MNRDPATGNIKCTQHGMQPKDHFYFLSAKRAEGRVYVDARCKQYMNEKQMNWYWKLKKDPKRYRIHRAKQRVYLRERYRRQHRVHPDNYRIKATA